MEGGSRHGMDNCHTCSSGMLLMNLRFIEENLQRPAFACIWKCSNYLLSLAASDPWFCGFQLTSTGEFYCLKGRNFIPSLFLRLDT